MRVSLVLFSKRQKGIPLECNSPRMRGPTYPRNEKTAVLWASPTAPGVNSLLVTTTQRGTCDAPCRRTLPGRRVSTAPMGRLPELRSDRPGTRGHRRPGPRLAGHFDGESQCWKISATAARIRRGTSGSTRRSEGDGFQADPVGFTLNVCRIDVRVLSLSRAQVFLHHLHRHGRRSSASLTCSVRTSRIVSFSPFNGRRTQYRTATDGIANKSAMQITPRPAPSKKMRKWTRQPRTRFPR